MLYKRNKAASLNVLLAKASALLTGLVRSVLVSLMTSNSSKLKCPACLISGPHRKHPQIAEHRLFGGRERDKGTAAVFLLPSRRLKMAARLRIHSWPSSSGGKICCVRVTRKAPASVAVTQRQLYIRGNASRGLGAGLT